MCGIFAFLKNHSFILKSDQDLRKSANASRRRGPESTSFLDLESVFVGFHRLAINGLDNISNQPIIIDGIYLICNGEIYNHAQLVRQMQVTPITQSDCEVIIWLYKKYGIMQALTLLDGVFAFFMYDSTQNMAFVSRDPYGVRPMYACIDTDHAVFASELKQLTDFRHANIQQFKPGTFQAFSYADSTWKEVEKLQYHTLGLARSPYNIESDYQHGIYYHLSKAVHKRVQCTERPIACLLSGGLDSSLICALVNEFTEKKIETYSIGLEGSEDSKYAKLMAEHIKSKHTNIVVTEDDFFDAIEEVIQIIESYDTTTVRASVGNYLIAKHISATSNAKVIFNGDGSDELTGGYMYFHAAPDAYAFDGECRRLLRDICYFDVLRSDRSISSNGLEPRTPFLDRTFVDYYLSIPAEIRHPVGKIEKYVLRKAVERYNLLPSKILWRSKEAFSDGVSSTNRSWYEIIQEKIESKLPEISDDLEKMTNIHPNPPKTIEQKYYRMIYEKYYNECGHTTPYFWMPRFISATDSSARTLSIYKERNSQQKI